MAFDNDPYLYPGTTILRNKLGLRDAAALERVQDDLAAQRYFELARTMPAPPFTFETLKGIHRHLFQDVYDWAGEPRTIGIRKAEWDAPNSQMTTFTDPTKIPGMARVIFNAIGQGRTLMDLDRETFAARAAELLNDLNIVHPFRVMLNCKSEPEFRPGQPHPTQPRYLLQRA